MSTLSNVILREDGSTLQAIGTTPDAPSEADNISSGVSVRYARKYEKAWYVLRITYRREQRVYAHIIGLGIEAYLPLHRFEERTTEYPIRIRTIVRPLVPGIVFVYTTKDIVDSLIKGDNHIDGITPYYDHFRKNERGYNDYLTVPGDQMDNFMRLASIVDKHIKTVSPSQCHYKSGDTVIIKEGKFKGIIGRVARVSGQQRVVVTLDGVCSIVTAYIPTAFLEEYRVS